MRSRVFVAAWMVVFSVALTAQPARPKITGISHIAVYTSNPDATERYYTFTVGAVRLPDPENSRGVRYALDATQFVEVLPLPADAGVNRLDHTAYNTESAEGMRKYLAAKGWKVPAAVTRLADGSRVFAVLDPEGNKVEFVQPNPRAKVDAPNAIGHHIIHIGFLVRDRAKEDTFYRALLGFQPYWFGGMKADEIDWVSQQVPDGHDWLEYMLTSGTNISQRLLGVLDHLSLGQDSVDAGYAMLKGAGRLEDVRADTQTKIGRDGKGQFNLYDPDGIRLELMNWHATQKPCCSPFTAADPTP